MRNTISLSLLDLEPETERILSTPLGRDRNSWIWYEGKSQNRGRSKFYLPEKPIQVETIRSMDSCMVKALLCTRGTWKYCAIPEFKKRRPRFYEPGIIGIARNTVSAYGREHCQNFIRSLEEVWNIGETALEPVTSSVAFDEEYLQAFVAEVKATYDNSYPSAQSLIIDDAQSFDDPMFLPWARKAQDITWEFTYEALLDWGIHPAELYLGAAYFQEKLRPPGIWLCLNSDNQLAVVPGWVEEEAIKNIATNKDEESDDNFFRLACFVTKEALENQSYLSFIESCITAEKKAFDVRGNTANIEQLETWRQRIKETSSRNTPQLGFATMGNCRLIRRIF